MRLGSAAEGEGARGAAGERLIRALGPGAVRRDVPLATLGRWRIGGPADLLVTPRSVAELAETLRVVRDFGVPHVVVGDGSNLLFDDEGFRGAVVRVGRAFSGFAVHEGGEVEAGAGLWAPAFVRRVIGAGLAGATHAVGIPGTLGGLLAMNGGSQRRGIGENVLWVEALDRGGRLRRLDRAELGYAYRASRLQAGGLVAVGARFRFAPGDRAALRREAIGILAARRAKFPRVRANCGSVFVSDPELYRLVGPPGQAIERAGLKGRRIGDAQISPTHANFIVNLGRARSADVLALVDLARRRVRELTGVALAAEVRHLSPDGVLRPAHDALPAPASEPSA